MIAFKVNKNLKPIVEGFGYTVGLFNTINLINTRVSHGRANIGNLVSTTNLFGIVVDIDGDQYLIHHNGGKSWLNANAVLKTYKLL